MGFQYEFWTYINIQCTPLYYGLRNSFSYPFHLNHCRAFNSHQRHPVTFQTSSPRTHLNLTQVKCDSDSQNSFVVVTCKVKQAIYFQNTVVGLVFSRHCHLNRKIKEKRSEVPRKHKNQRGKHYEIFKFQKQFCLPLLKLCPTRQKPPFLNRWDGSNAGYSVDDPVVLCCSPTQHAVLYSAGAYTAVLLWGRSLPLSQLPYVLVSS